MWDKLSWRKRKRVLYTSLISVWVLLVCVYPCPLVSNVWGGSMHLITLGSLLAPNEHGWTISGCEMSSLWYGCLESEVVRWSGCLPQLQSHRVEKDLIKLSKDYKERLEQQTFLCPAVKAFLTLMRCGIRCEYALPFVSKCHFPQCCVCVCERERFTVGFTVGSKRGWWHWENAIWTIPLIKNVTLQSDRVARKTTVEITTQGAESFFSSSRVVQRFFQRWHPAYCRFLSHRNFQGHISTNHTKRRLKHAMSYEWKYRDHRVTDPSITEIHRNQKKVMTCGGVFLDTSYFSQRTSFC